MMNVRVENLGRRATHFARDQSETSFCVNGRFMLGQDD